MRNRPVYEELVNLLNKKIHFLDTGNNDTLLPIINAIGESRFVLMGEASHGTKEFYQARIALTKLLIEKKGFHAIAIEGDWPSAYPVHQYIQGHSEKSKVIESLNEFKRFPTWMWRNTTLSPFISWLRQYNDQLREDAFKVGFYGLDLYSLHDSMQAIIDYLKKHQPDIVEKAIRRYNCFDHIAVDPQMYGYLVNRSIKHACIKEVIEQFLEIQRQASIQLKSQSLSDAESLYYATQNARLVKNAEEYYRSMFEPRAISWNIRDRHMAQILTNLSAHIESLLKLPAKIIVWAHNSHVGDARATEMSDRGETNLGQIIREDYDVASYLLGFTTYTGSVRAASNWGAKGEIKKVNPALEGSYESLFHDVRERNFFLNLREESYLTHLLKQPELERAIGVIYLPESERISHYFFSRLPYQFDGIIHFDTTAAVMPLDGRGDSDPEELPETYPTGM